MQTKLLQLLHLPQSLWFLSYMTHMSNWMRKLCWSLFCLHTILSVSSIFTHQPLKTLRSAAMTHGAEIEEEKKNHFPVWLSLSPHPSFGVAGWFSIFRDCPFLSSKLCAATSPFGLLESRRGWDYQGRYPCLLLIFSGRGLKRKCPHKCTTDQRKYI